MKEIDKLDEREPRRLPFALRSGAVFSGEAGDQVGTDFDASTCLRRRIAQLETENDLLRQQLDEERAHRQIINCEMTEVLKKC